VIVNTCTVTHRADSDARKLIRSVRRGNPGCKLLVTGCYAEREPRALSELAGVDRIFGNRDKGRLGTILDQLGVHGPQGFASVPDRGCDAALTLPRALHFGERSRAFLKIQEGCRLRCSYCIVPQVRGPSRSVRPGSVVDAAVSLARAGYREIVLTGVNTGDYGRDLTPSADLAGLLRRLLDACQGSRFRLNSLEPLTVTDEIIALMSSEPRLASHLQVPLQSGSPEMLRRMRRNYTTTTYLERLERLRAAVPDVALGADVIVGFPGETEAWFEETCRLIARSPLSYLHVFSWSARPGTPAAKLDGRVAPPVIRRRSARLRSLGDRLALSFRERFVGRRLDAVVLGGRNGDRRLRALTGNFIEADLEPGSARPGSAANLRIVRVEPERTVARLVDVPEWAARGVSGRGL
jgi:threonylcarbamoyladenosine tRNA methylthiotransferase MtaB